MSDQFLQGHPFLVDRLEHPIVQAPMGGGPSTPALAAAVAEAGGLGFLAAGYKAPGDVRSDIAELRSLTGKPFGVNLFAPPGPAGDPDELARYAAELREDAARYGVEPGEPLHDDDSYAEKLALMAAERAPVVSFTFACPAPVDVERLHDAGAEVWVTVTTPAKAPSRPRPVRTPSSSRASRPAATGAASTTTGPATSACWPCSSSCVT